MLIIGNDHAGTGLKNLLVDWAREQNVEVINHGTDGVDSVDYPDFAKAVCKDLNTKNGLGVLICGSGNGIAMTANKFKHIRAAICWNTELASLARQHNNANVLVLPARFVSEAEGLEILKAFLSAEFEGGRHERRVNKIIE
ncbi:ribose 5-phosphate isomerase B [Luteibaculum oceani]|uniref:Ribose 5-phosphate isomerase B n=1 Tax=Luteibaculum oceani TaxID=1294296 RepID=A0A5C6VK50_9FLAO|nr:ribose 5-phosphate isomerase B [Luteibaculum oceani]TXC85359.1 ribose 5-phosphate isomerase B [Luteibaculum oceani]